MIHFEDFNFLSLQVVAFTSNSDDFRSARILSRIIPKFATRFDGEIESQIPPFDIKITDKNLRISPYVSMASEDKQWKLVVTPSRTDSFWQRGLRLSGEDNIEAICSECLAPVLAYPVGEGIQIGRLALVVNRYFTSETSASEIAENFCKNEFIDETRADAPFRHSQKFEIHNLKTYRSDVDSDSGKMMVNSWVRCRGGISVDEKSALVVEQDINTLTEDADNRALTEEQIVSFFEWSRNELDQILSLYFRRKN